MIIYSNGWISSCSYMNYGTCDGLIDASNPLSASFAACLGNAELFRWSNKMNSSGNCKWYDLYNMRTSSQKIANDKKFNSDISFGRMHLVGCGAIGSSFTFLLSFTNWEGKILFVDMDMEIEGHNTSSSLLFTKKQVENKINKVNTCAQYLNGSKIKTEVFADDYSKYPYEHSSVEKSADLIMCFANDNNIWSTIQNIYPPIVFHATTSKAWGINIGRHIPLIDHCLMCTFQDLIKVKYVPICAEGEMPAIQQPKEAHTAILPFLSPAAAILTLSSLAQLLDEETNENSLEFNMSTAEGIFLKEYYSPLGCYVCKNQKQSTCETLNQNSKFWELSNKIIR
jgi:hypothetical protein